MSSLAQLQEDVQGLTAQERAQLMDTLAYANRRSAPAGLSREEQLVFDTICELSESTISFKKFMDVYGRKKFGEKVVELFDFARSNGAVLRQVQIDGLVKTSLRCLASEMQARYAVAVETKTTAAPVTPKNLLDHLSLMRMAVDRRFPGYMAAGMLHRVVPA